MRITSKGQVTIPQAIRERCGLLPHTEVDFVEEADGRVVLQPAQLREGRSQQAIERIRRARLSTRMSTDEILALTRGEEP